MCHEGSMLLDAAVASYPGDLTTLPGGESPPPGEGATKSKRKQTLLSLLDALQELSRDEELDVSGSSQLRAECMRMLRQFYRQLQHNNPASKGTVTSVCVR